MDILSSPCDHVVLSHEQVSQHHQMRMRSWRIERQEQELGDWMHLPDDTDSKQSSSQSIRLFRREALTTEFTIKSIGCQIWWQSIQPIKAFFTLQSWVDRNCPPASAETSQGCLSDEKSIQECWQKGSPLKTFAGFQSSVIPRLFWTVIKSNVSVLKRVGSFLTIRSLTLHM
jgi:hypothetical protein